ASGPAKCGPLCERWPNYLNFLLWSLNGMGLFEALKEKGKLEVGAFEMASRNATSCSNIIPVLEGIRCQKPSTASRCRHRKGENFRLLRHVIIKLARFPQQLGQKTLQCRAEAGVDDSYLAPTKPQNPKGDPSNIVNIHLLNAVDWLDLLL